MPNETRTTNPSPRRRTSVARQGQTPRHAASPSERRAANRTAQRQPREARRTGASRTAAAPQKPASKPAGKRYIPALDGLRTLAVFAVMGFHLNFTWCNGGLLGVTMFFVLSGYLITGLLANEFESSGTINLPQFWLRRVRRLFPAIVLVVLCTTLLCVLFNHVLLTKLRPDVLPSLFWMQNWWYILRDLSYFEALGDPSPLTHFWSLAIEEQFYVVWPLIVFAAYKLGGGRRWIQRGCIILGILSVAAMFILYNPQADPTRVYYGTDTRAFSLLIGAWLSLAWPGAQLSEEHSAGASPQAVRILDLVGAVALVGLVIMLSVVDGMGEFMYRGGILLASILTAVLICALVHPQSWLGKFFALPPLVWLGKRSYGMYLWHYPIFLLLKPLNSSGPTYDAWVAVLAVALTILVSAASYTFVEEPIRHGAIGKLIGEVRQFGTRVLSERVIAYKIPCAICAVLIAVTVGGCTFIPDENVVPEDVIVSTGASADQAVQIEEPNPNAYDMILIGDSVPAALDQFGFYDLFPHSHEDSYIGRWFYQAVNVYKDYDAQGVVGNVVVIACFSNHALGDDELDQLYEAVGEKKQLFLINVYAPLAFVDDTNAQIAAFANAHKNVHVIDWHSACSQDPMQYLWADGIHMRPEGDEVYLKLIDDAVRSYLPEHPEDNVKQEEEKSDGEQQKSE